MAGEATDFLVMLQLWLLLNFRAVQACDPPCLYFSAGRAIKSIELSSNKITSNITGPQAHDVRVIALAVDVEEETLYFSDQLSRNIKRIDLKSSKIEDIASEVGYCEDIAIDWVNKYIYWTDNDNGRIEMSRVNGSDRKVLFDRDLEKPRGITVDPVHGYMFWTDYGDNPKIERATLAGQERTTIIANNDITRLKHPNDVLVDYTSNKIYWVDAGPNVVGTADLEGRNIKISEPIKNSRLFAVALYNNTLYITDWEMNAKSIIVIDRESLREISRFSSSVIGSRDLFGLTLLHESRQPPVSSPCSRGNGKCSHLCFIVPGGSRCGCPSGTALREDGHFCQKANFTNCRNQPCQNGGTCYFNFQTFADNCKCSKYYAEEDCALYLGAGAVGVTLEMNIKEWEEVTFKQAIMRELYDYCKEDNCGLRNKSISKQFCPCFLNNSAFSATQVTVIGQPVAWLPDHTKVDFAVILRPVSSSKPLVVLNTTLEHIVWERANSISKHHQKIVLVNNLPPSSDTRCNEQNDISVEKEETTKSKTTAIAIGITVGITVVVLLVFVAVCCRRKRRNLANREENDHENELGPLAEERDNQPRANNGAGNNEAYEFDHQEDQRDGRNGIDGGYEAILPAGQRQNQQRGINREGINGGYVELLAEQRENQQRDNNGVGNNGAYEFDHQEEQRDNRNGNDGGYEAILPAGQRENQQRGNNREGINGGYVELLVEQRENQPRDNNGNGGYEGNPLGEQRYNSINGNDDGCEAVLQAEQRENQQRGNNREEIGGGNEFYTLAEQRENHQRANNEEENNGSCRIVFDKDFNNIAISFGGANRNTIDNQNRDNL